ncbi:MAG: hypothetical protein JW797_09255 [Bradymonadales bacterium]|nr:hypothetical protein [Bradymonadales bacterium]
MKRVEMLLVLLLLASGVSCAETEGEAAPTCGQDTVQEGNQCLPVLTCGPDTHLDGNTCVSDTDYTCHPDTQNVDGVCQADPGPTCGEGTILVEGQCVLETRRSCGEGTIEQLGQCVVAEPRSCGEGTRREDDLCVPDPHCSQDAVVVDNRCVSIWTRGDSIYTACTAAARAYCGQISECCDPYDPWAGETLLSHILKDPLVCETLLENICYDRLYPQMVYVAAGEAEPVDDPLAVLMPYYTVDTCSVLAGVAGLPFAALPADTVVVDGLRRPGDSCLGNLSCVEGQTCVTDASGNPVCKERGSGGHLCDRGDDADCNDGYYCRLYDDGIDRCFGYLDIDERGCSSARRCNPQEAFCQYTDVGSGEMDYVCTALLAEGEPCPTGTVCQEGFYCRVYYDDGSSTWIRECTPYRTNSEGCSSEEDLRCGSDTFCVDDTCIEQLDICLLSEGAYN